MRRLPFLILALLATTVSADDSLRRANGRLRARQYEQNRLLVKAMVQETLGLAEARDPLERVDYCKTLAQGFADELARALAAKEDERAEELGRHLGSILKTGVARNLSALNDANLSLSHFLRIQEVGKQLTAAVTPLEKQLRDATATEGDRLDQIRRQLEAGRGDVETVVRAIGEKNKPETRNPKPETKN